MANIRLNYIEGKSYNLTISVQNTSTRGGLSAAATMKLGVSASLLNGVVLIPGQGISYNFAAGEQRSFLLPFTIPTGTGGLSGTASATVMSPDGVVVGSGTADIVVLPAATGEVNAGLIWYEGLAGWESTISGRQVPTGVPIYLAPGWINFSSSNIVGHIDLIMDGTALSATENQDKEAAPNNGWHVRFTPVILSTGTHTFVVKLSSGGQVLATGTFTLVTSATAVAVSSIPNGASIYINGTPMGQTPVTISLVPGTYTITFKLTGYQDYTGQFTLTGEYTSTSLGVTLVPIPPPATPHLTFGTLTGSYTVIYGGYYPILRCKITNNNEVAIIGRDILAFNRYTSPYSGLPVEYSGSIKDTTKVYGVPAYGPAPGLITLQPGASIDIDWMPNFSIPRDVVNSLWLFDTVTGDKSNIIYLP